MALAPIRFNPYFGPMTPGRPGPAPAAGGVIRTSDWFPESPGAPLVLFQTLDHMALGNQFIIASGFNSFQLTIELANVPTAVVELSVWLVNPDEAMPFATVSLFDTAITIAPLLAGPFIGTFTWGAFNVNGSPRVSETLGWVWTKFVFAWANTGSDVEAKQLTIFAGKR